MKMVRPLSTDGARPLSPPQEASSRIPGIANNSRFMATDGRTHPSSASTSHVTPARPGSILINEVFLHGGLDEAAARVPARDRGCDVRLALELRLGDDPGPPLHRDG